MTCDPILMADKAEEDAAAEALRAATTQQELTDAWYLNAEHFTGSARERLQDVYADRLVQFAPMGRAG